MATKKKGLGRGLDGMIQQPTAAVIPVQTLAGQQEQEVRTPPPVHPEAA